jgi:hypothetical protein
VGGCSQDGLASNLHSKVKKISFFAFLIFVAGSWHQVYGQGSQESLFQEALQPVQEAWGHVSCTTLVIVVGLRKTERRPTKKIEKLEKALKKSSKKSTKR